MVYAISITNMLTLTFDYPLDERHVKSEKKKGRSVTASRAKKKTEERED